MAGHGRPKDGVLRSPMSRPSTPSFVAKAWMPGTRPGMTWRVVLTPPLRCAPSAPAWPSSRPAPSTFAARPRLEARRHRAVLARQDLVVLDVERAQPSLLAHGQRDEVADLDQLRLAEVLVQPRPEFLVDRQVPGDRLGVGEGGLLLVAVLRGRLEIDQVLGVVLDHRAGVGGLDRALVAAEFAQHRARHIEPAQLLDAVIGDPGVEHVAPRVGERPEHRGDVGADRLALRPRRAVALAAFQLGEHGRVLHGLRIDVADVGLAHAVHLYCLARRGRLNGC